MTFFDTLTNPVVGYSVCGRQRWHCRVGFQGSILACNNGAERVYGWTECEAQKMTIDELIPRQRRKAEKAFIDKLKKGETVKSLRTQRLNKDAKILDVGLTVAVLKDDSVKPIEIATTERDLAWLPSARAL